MVLEKAVAFFDLPTTTLAAKRQKNKGQIKKTPLEPTCQWVCLVDEIVHSLTGHDLTVYDNLGILDRAGGLHAVTYGKMSKKKYTSMQY